MKASVSFLIDKDTTEKSNPCHDCGKDKGQTIIPCLVENETSHTCPKTSAKTVKRRNETRKKPDMRKPIESPKQGGGEWTRDKIGEAKDHAQ